MKTELNRYIGRIALTADSLNYRIKYFTDSELESVFPYLEKIKLACSILNSVLGEIENVEKEHKNRC